MSKHPRGLYVLFGTEMWERLSYYGMRAILMLYMVAPIAAGGLAFDTPRAAHLYGTYTSAVYLTPLIGGWIADRFLGARLTVLIGGIIIASGHFCMAFPSLTTFYTGLVLIVAGTGLLKANITTMVGSLYEEDDPRRDAGFSIFYMGINLGAFLAPFVCGTLAQAPVVKVWLQSHGIDPNMSWHFGFAAAGVGMTLGLIQYLLQQKQIAHVGNRPQKAAVQKAKGAAKISTEALTREELKRIAAILCLFFFSALFWMVFEQAGSSMNLFADQLTRNSIFGFQFPSSWFQSANPVMIIILAPVLSWLWLKLKDRQPSSPAKFVFGLAFAGGGFLVLAWASKLSGGGLVSPMWLVIVYFLHTIGELCLSPIGLSTVTKLAPARIVGLMMGFWFLSLSLGNYMAGWLAGFFRAGDESVLVNLFGGVGLIALGAALFLVFLVPPLRRLMCHVR
ncbi:MAG: hypothetical protein A2W61_06980 [Deltaproteobacteria bacterium RIFCSPLOWO2_01_44_7]|nr:MAG: hypothetical protein A2712_11135 [Deltaproteobacteria bacterium RIFCSPHIGHO2_01_FULL_43_49]OGQ16601.1 MAG: hypothetical protein A3D22_06835 [Deltaproteobacteria bacterium RIFCSPHIGHO2_02_FULL_44_53]OGQ28416.1 MAG: hypothetical protein A3D98_06540 [Deltaproteobacteria bacterium RIFCSPHIGHO2_12_FULL_44_21]OGQ32488.1 MAG: hypothetical protein A2979_11100 [Deltaproteobacteria bacterium RIFCSPLOWO2_01_FULL_45_74]OGQ39164.1 MAG: hypothetical protein A2W61_06980 [Deltaproteobacteria bacterium 